MWMSATAAIAAVVAESPSVAVLAHRPVERIQGFTRSHWMPPSVGGPVVSFPPIFLSLQNHQKKSFAVSRANNNKKQANHGLTGGALSTMTYFPLPSLPPLDQTISFPSQGNQYFSRRCGITHAGCDAAASAKMA